MVKEGGYAKIKKSMAGWNYNWHPVLDPVRCGHYTGSDEGVVRVMKISDVRGLSRSSCDYMVLVMTSKGKLASFDLTALEPTTVLGFKYIKRHEIKNR